MKGDEVRDRIDIRRRGMGSVRARREGKKCKEGKGEMESGSDNRK